MSRKDILFILTLTARVAVLGNLVGGTSRGGEIEEITSEERHIFNPHLDIKGNSGEEGIHFYSHLDSRGVLGLGKKIPFCEFFCRVNLKVHKIEIFFGFDFEICSISLIIRSKY